VLYKLKEKLVDIESFVELLIALVFAFLLALATVPSMLKEYYFTKKRS